MNKQNLFAALAVIMILINIGLLSFLFLKPKIENSKGPKDYIVQKLDFDDEQVKAYEEVIEKHSSASRILKDSEEELSTLLYDQLNANQNAQTDSLLQKLGELRMQIDKLNYNHFIEIKTICRPNQKEKFANLTKELHLLFNKRPRKK